MKYTSMELGRVVRETRTSLGLTQGSLALAAGTGLRFIVDLEKGKPTCQLQKALMVLNTLGIKMALTSPAVDTGQNLTKEQGSR
jgi:HTH-type transcriptional regulator/antitoxin HipB